MSYALYGSRTSPFVRRIRLLMENLPYEFKEVDIFGADKELLKKINPVNQIPVLIDGEQVIWDSRMIFSYLNLRHRFQNIDWEDENLLTAVDGAMNSAVTLLLARRSGIDLNSGIMYFDRQKERIESVLDYLRPYIAERALKEWNFHTMSLYSFLDWALFRELITIEHRPECRQLLETYFQKPIVIATQIPKA